MHEFLVRFVATALDEEALRERLAKKGLTDISITQRPVDARQGPDPKPSIAHSAAQRSLLPGEETKSPTAPPEIRRAGGREEMDRAILSVAELMEVFGAPEVVDRYPVLEQSDVSRRLSRLVRSGVLERIEFGLYVRTGAPSPDTKMLEAIRARRSVTRTMPADQFLLDFLTTPRDLGEIRRHLGVSPQRAGQRLKRLLSSNRVVRHKETSGVLYGLSLDEIRAADLRRRKDLPDSALSILGSLPDRGPISQSALSETHGRADRTIRSEIETLQKANLVEVRRLGGRPMICLSERGQAHPGRATVGPLPAEDLKAIIGPARVNVLIALDLLGPLTARELS